MQQQLAYWKEHLAGAPASLDLPTDRPRPAVQAFKGITTTFTLPRPLLEGLNDLSCKNDVTLFITLLAGFKALLSRYSGQEDIVVGTAVNGGNLLQTPAPVGLLSNTLPLRTKLSGDPSFQEIIIRVKETTLGGYAHQEVPLETLVEELRLELSLSHHPLVQVLFALQDANTLQSNGLESKLIGSGTGAATCDMFLWMLEGREGLEGRLECDGELFDSATLERFVEHYHVLLEAVISNPGLRLSQLPLLASAERQRLLVDWNATEFEYPRSLCLHQWFEQQAERTPEAIACMLPGETEPGDGMVPGRGNGDQQLTYSELNGRANQVGHYLRQRGIGPGQRVGVYVERSLQMMVALLGIQKSGAAYVPLDPAYPSERVRLTLEDAQVSVVLTQQALLAALPEHQAEVFCLDTDWEKIARQSRSNFSSGATPKDLVYVIFTSGSTGRPKGVQVPHGAVVNLLSFMAQELRMGPRDVFPALASFAFDMCIPELYLGLVTGGMVVIGRRNLAANGEELARLLRRIGATIIHATPTTWNLLLEAGFSGRGLKRIIGAEPLPPELATRLLEADASLYNFYGPTETTVWSAFHHFRSEHEPIVIGRPLANTQIYILDRNLQPTPIGVPGEIHIGGDGVARGYLNRPELTAEKFIPNPFSHKPDARLYKTGDLGRYLVDGRIEFQGRSDNQVKVRGYRIELGEIEAALGRHASVQECIVIAREDLPGDKQLVGYVVPNSGQSIDVSALRAWVKERLPEYMVPRAIVGMSRLPRLPNGKVDRKNVPAPDYTRPELAREYLAPRTPGEEVMANIWATVLKLDRVGIDDDFFELGGHSLLAARLMSEIRRVTGRKIPMSAVLRAATVESLARLVAAGESTLADDPLVMPIQQGREGHHPLFAVIVPGVEAIGYAALARHLDPQQPFYKLQGKEPTVASLPLDPDEISRMGCDYIAAMRSVQPEGPYCFIGMCDDVQVCEEMIIQLERVGQKIGFLAVLDTWVVQNTMVPWKWRIHYYATRLGRMSRLQPVEHFKGWWKILHRKIDDVDQQVRAADERRAWRRAYWPGPEFKPPMFRAPVLLFKRPKQPFYYTNDPLMGWGQRSLGGVEIKEIEFDHDNLLREPHISAIGEILTARLQKLDR